MVALACLAMLHRLRARLACWAGFRDVSWDALMASSSSIASIGRGEAEEEEEDVLGASACMAWRADTSASSDSTTGAALASTAAVESILAC
jgi:hypothetical protein